MFAHLRYRFALLLAVLTATALGPLAAGAEASHFRSANMNWERAGGTVENATPVRFNMVLSYSWQNNGQPAVGHEQAYESIDLGDGNFVSPTFRVTFVNQSEDYFIAEAIEAPGSTQRGFVHNYAGTGPFDARFSSCCTISNLQNAPNAYYGVVTQIDLTKDDESPKTSLPPIVSLPEGGSQTFNVPATDAGGETLTYRLTTPAESCGNCTSPPQDPHPPGLAINSTTGQVSWDTTGRAGLWYSGVVVEARDALGAVVSTTQVNYIISVGGSGGNQQPTWDNPPTPADGSEFTLVPGQTCNLSLQARDPDSANTVSIAKTSGPGVLSPTDGNPATGAYSYTPQASDVGASQIIQFVATDNGVPGSSAPPRSYTLTVVSGPAGDGCATPAAATTPPPATLTLTPATATRTVGESHTVLAHAENGSGPVRFFVNGAHFTSGVTGTDGAGDALFSYPSSTPGDDRIFAYLDLNGNGVQNRDEPGANATVSWSPPQQQPRENELPPHILVADDIDDLPNPQPFRNANVEPTGRGEVFVQLPPDSRDARSSQASKAPRGFIPLRQAAQLPMGSVLETSNGKVLVESTATTSSRRTQRAEFFDGRFQMLQKRLRRSRRPVTEMVLKGGSRRGCPATPRVKGSSREAEGSRHARRRSSRSRVRRLWGRGRGNFRTRGRYSSATVRGTTWLVEDRCGGTLTRLPRRPRNSRVDVRDLGQRRTVQLRAGQSYLARPRGARRTR